MKAIESEGSFSRRRKQSSISAARTLRSSALMEESQMSSGVSASLSNSPSVALASSLILAMSVDGRKRSRSETKKASVGHKKPIISERISHSPV